MMSGDPTSNAKHLFPMTLVKLLKKLARPILAPVTSASVTAASLVVLEYIQHDYDRLNFIPSADYLIVEGTSQGRMSGKLWAGGKTPGGRFCNVFKLRDGRISSLHIYLDPDYTGEDEARFRWGKNRQW
jgi:hypothetical protein